MPGDLTRINATPLHGYTRQQQKLKKRLLRGRQSLICKMPRAPGTRHLKNQDLTHLRRRPKTQPAKPRLTNAKEPGSGTALGGGV